MAERSVVHRSFTPLNVHVAFVAVFLLLDLVVGTRLLLAWHRAGSDRSASYSADLLTYSRLQTESLRLRNLPEALQKSEKGADRFFDARLAPSDSAAVADLGGLTTRNHVRLSRATYSFRPGVPGVTELRIEANFAGQYTDLMHFINDVERDKDHAFFIIRSVALSGQQGGLVDLRLRMDTYMHADGSPLPVPGANEEGQ